MSDNGRMCVTVKGNKVVAVTGVPDDQGKWSRPVQNTGIRHRWAVLCINNKKEMNCVLNKFH